MKVSLRGPLRLQATPNLLLPLFNLASVPLLTAGLVAPPFVWSDAAAAGFAMVAAVTLLRSATLMPVNGEQGQAGLTVPEALGEAFACANVRALALVVRVSHGIRKRG